jgi:hypothetical protein
MVGRQVEADIEGLLPVRRFDGVELLSSSAT